MTTPPIDPQPAAAPAPETETKISRRIFLSSAAAGAIMLGTGCSGFPTIVPRHVVGGPNFVPPSEKVRLVGIGVGGRGSHDFRSLARNEVAVAVCDVNSDAMKNALLPHKESNFPGFQNVKQYNDYREMLELEQDNYDAVLVATPDHHHARATLEALRLKKHVYCEKPLCHNIHEAQLLQDAARAAGSVAVMGIQGHASADARTIVEWVDQGAIGNPTEVLMWTDRPLWKAGRNPPYEPQPVPGFLDWDKWLGAAEMRPYHPDYIGPWRGWIDFGAGALGDIGCHTMDASFWALGLTEPERIEVDAPGCNGSSFPEWSIITYYFPAGKLPSGKSRGPIKVTWYDGLKKPPEPKELTDENRKLAENGQILIGDGGKIMAGMYAEGARLIPESAMQKWAKNWKKELPRIQHKDPVVDLQHQQFLSACRGEKDPLIANFDYAAPLTRMVLTGNLAVITGRTIEWNAAQRRVTNYDKANEYLSRHYRRGWQV